MKYSEHISGSSLTVEDVLSSLLRSRTEPDTALGTYIQGVLVRKEDQRPKDYSETHLYPRSGHADISRSSGDGHNIAREIIGQLTPFLPTTRSPQPTTLARRLRAPSPALTDDDESVEDALGTREYADVQPTRCPPVETSEGMTQVCFPLTCVHQAALTSLHRIAVSLSTLTPGPRSATFALRTHDCIGGTVTYVIRNVVAGVGQPVFDVFDRLEGKLAHAMLSIAATKSFGIGSCFRGTY